MTRTESDFRMSSLWLSVFSSFGLIVTLLSGITQDTLLHGSSACCEQCQEAVYLFSKHSVDSTVVLFLILYSSSIVFNILIGILGYKFYYTLRESDNLLFLGKVGVFLSLNRLVMCLGFSSMLYLISNAVYAVFATKLRRQYTERLT